MVSMFGAERRLVEIDDADPFVKENRPDLEDYVESPSDGGILLLFVESFPGNTRLFKTVGAHGWRLTVLRRVRPGGDLVDGWAKTQHKMKISSGVARVLVDIVGPELGLLDQELAKLALVVDDGEAVSEELVCKMVGSWRAKTAWDMLDMALEGRAKDAMVQLIACCSAGSSRSPFWARSPPPSAVWPLATRVVFQAEAGR